MKASITNQQSTIHNPDPSRDYLWFNLCELPYFRSLMRAVEASYYSDIDLPEPVLDVGCGDGHFVTVAFDRLIDVGLDPGRAPLQEAAKRGGYHSLVQADGGLMPFPNSHFASAFSNSVLEHIPQVESVLKEIARVLKPGAPFVFCGPNQNFLAALALGRVLDRAHLRRLGDAYRAFFNRISRHYHSDSPDVWQARLERTGFRLHETWNYYPPAALQVTEWGHYFGLPSLLAHAFTGRWILIHQRWNLALTESYTRRYFDPSPCQDGVCSFYIARREG